jgi:hypothetical protein
MRERLRYMRGMALFWSASGPQPQRKAGWLVTPKAPSTDRPQISALNGNLDLSVRRPTPRISTHTGHEIDAMAGGQRHGAQSSCGHPSRRPPLAASSG